MIVFRSIKPGVKFKSSTFREEIRKAAEKMAPAIKADFEKTTRTWEHEVEFTTEVNIGRAAGGYIAGKAGITTGAEISVTTDDDIYRYVDEGTKPHIIRPRRRRGPRKAAHTLAFQMGGRPKTTPNVIGSTSGRKGNKWAFAKEVHHPGTKARNFSQVIHRKWQPRFRTEMQAALNRAAKRSGHSLP